MSQNLINAIDLPSGTLPTTPVVIKDNNLAGMFNNSDYKYSDYGIPELTYRYVDGDTNNITSEQAIQAVENGYYPIIKVSSNSSSRGRGPLPSDELYPGIWGFSYYFYKNDTPYAMFTCLQEFSAESAESSGSASLKSPSLKGEILRLKNDYLGTFTGYLVNDNGRWLTTTDLFSSNTSSGGGAMDK